MVTKPSRYQTRRTNTPGKVFSASELLDYELGLNVPDRKLFSKDLNGNVFQVAGAAGRNPGDYVKYEDLGDGLQALGIKTGGRLWVKHDTDTTGDFTTFWVTRNPPAGGTYAQVNSAIRAQTKVDFKTDAFEWGITSTLEVNAAGGGEHCAGYFRAQKNADGTAWAICLENRDFVPQPQSGTVAAEIGLFVKGKDDLGRRIGIHLSLNSADNADGENVVGSALVIGGPSAKVQVTRMIRLQGAGFVGIDFTEMDTNYSNIGINMKTEQVIQWKDSLDGTTRGGLRWTSALGGNWQWSGIATTPSAGAIVEYETVIINGNLRKRALYAV
ncbi:hypothetical protein G8E10_09645 [Rhizobiaceae bacterium CRRU44]|uniref:Uncharacterized protein n=1 Tax=Ferranicluibacter rubi TaxID=2715133 RepID=A0AA43ZFL8_9HYPH|nr:hypothetical protein [Ferranicluibacter rubi]NHT75937.1 hypothetical protein [Ferranicluibacter rubi]NHT75997.1 hypothetical protein [Ferranicluibacter rubi]